MANGNCHFQGDSLWQFRPVVGFCSEPGRAMALMEDADSHIYATGSICIDGKLRQLTVKLNQDGTVVWQKITPDTIGLERAVGFNLFLYQNKVAVFGFKIASNKFGEPLSIYELNAPETIIREPTIVLNTQVFLILKESILHGKKLYTFCEYPDQPDNNRFVLSCYQLED